jgi:hypothetical protein
VGDKIAKNEMGGVSIADAEERGVYRVLVVNPEGKRPLGRPRRRWEVILRWIFRKLNVGLWTGLGWLRIETGGEQL